MPAAPAADKPRCGWIKDPLMRVYHDDEWGVPVHDDRKHFEFLVLDGAQAGLSWSTVLKKREGYRRAFGGVTLPNAGSEGLHEATLRVSERRHHAIDQALRTRRLAVVIPQ